MDTMNTLMTKMRMTAGMSQPEMITHIEGTVTIEEDIKILLILKEILMIQKEVPHHTLQNLQKILNMKKEAGMVAKARKVSLIQELSTLGLQDP
jgi:hypothetical protein